MKTVSCSLISLLFITTFPITVTCQAAGLPVIAAPETVSIDRLANLFGPVQFDHQLHADYASCVECHHHTTGQTPSNPLCLNCHDNHTRTSNVSCSFCHSTSPYTEENEQTATPKVKFHIDIPDLKAAYHLSCLNCHQAIGAGPTECLDCHQLTDTGKLFYKTVPKPDKQ